MNTTTTRRNLFSVFLGGCALVLSFPAFAEERVLIVKTSNGPLIAELAAGFQSAFPGAKADEVLIEDGSKGMEELARQMKGARAVLAVGPRAAAVVTSVSPTIPTIALVPGAQANPKLHGPTLRLQPPVDGILAVMGWIGGYERVGFVSEASAPERMGIANVLSRQYGFKLIGVSVNGPREVAAAVARLVKDVEVVVVDVSDGLSMQDVGSLLRTADGAGIPVVGTSEGFIKAGAPMAIAADPRALGAEAGRLAGTEFRGMADPRRFRILANLLVTERLGVRVPRDRGTLEGSVLTIDTEVSELTSSRGGASTVRSTRPAVAKRGRLEYPPLALTGGIRRADVVLEVVVLADGTIGPTKVVEGDKLFSDAAVRSLSGWKFKPATRNGSPIDDTMRLNLRFER